MPVTIGGSGPITGVTSINTTVSDTELGYLDGVTSAIQTQLAGKGTINTNGDWTAYTPSLTAVTTNPTLGSGSGATGYYIQIGKLVVVRLQITFGTSGVNAGSGAYRVSLPVTNKLNSELSGTVFLFDSSTGAGTHVASAAYDAVSGSAALFYAPTTTTFANVSNSAPWTWAASDQIRCFLMYEAA